MHSTVSDRTLCGDPRRCSDVPNTVPNELGIRMSWRSTAIAHILKASIGTGGSSTNVGVLRKAVTSATVNLTNVRAPKYAARILFLKVIAYTLGRGRIGWIVIWSQTTHLNKMNTSEESKKIVNEIIWMLYEMRHLGTGMALAQNLHFSPGQTPVRSLTVSE